MAAGYPLVRAKGTHRELGLQHGLQASNQIRAFLDYLGHVLKLSRGGLHARAMRFRPLFERDCPHLWEEIEGLAEGAHVPLADALAVQIRGELGQLGDGACTTYVVSRQGTADGEVLIGQNCDMVPEISEFGYVLHLKPEGKPESLMWTFGGMLGYHGINAVGVGQFANALGGGPAWRFALPHYPLKRMMLECRSLKEVLALLCRVPVCSNGNYVLCDGQGEILDVELTPEAPLFLEDQGKGYLAHSNHFLCAPHACRENYDKSLPDSFPRLERMQELIESKLGGITVDGVKGFLKDHAGHPVSICRHPHDGLGDETLPNTGRTVTSLVAEPARGRLHVARGNPCENPFRVFHTDGKSNDGTTPT